MKLLFMGTAAAEGVPAGFCNCPTCVRARKLGGNDIRTRSQILIDGDTLFDFPADSYMHSLRFNVDLSAIKRVLFSHAHMDHCYAQEFITRGEPFARNLTEKKVTVYGNATVRDMFMADINREVRDNVAADIDFCTLSPFQEVQSGDMRIIALPAEHTKGEDCFVYYVERGGVGALLMNDTGVLDRSVFERLNGMGVNVRAAALDCTYVAKRHGPGRHMGLYDIADQTELMLSVGLIDSSTRIIATHLSHNTDLDFIGICAVADTLGITVAYDGLTVSVE